MLHHLAGANIGWQQKSVVDHADTSEGFGGGGVQMSMTFQLLII